MKTVTVIRWKHDEADYATSIKKAVEYAESLGHIVKKDQANSSYTMFEPGAEIEKSHFINPITKEKAWCWICVNGDYESGEISKQNLI